MQYPILITITFAAFNVVVSAVPIRTLGDTSVAHDKKISIKPRMMGVAGKNYPAAEETQPPPTLGEHEVRENYLQAQREKRAKEHPVQEDALLNTAPEQPQTIEAAREAFIDAINKEAGTQYAFQRAYKAWLSWKEGQVPADKSETSDEQVAEFENSLAKDRDQKANVYLTAEEKTNAAERKFHALSGRKPLEST